MRRLSLFAPDPTLNHQDTKALRGQEGRVQNSEIRTQSAELPDG